MENKHSPTPDNIRVGFEEKNNFNTHWSDQGNVVSAGSNIPITIKALAQEDFTILVKASYMEESDFNVNFSKNHIVISVSQHPVRAKENTLMQKTRENGQKTYERKFKIPKIYDIHRTSILFETGELQILVPKRKD